MISPIFDLGLDHRQIDRVLDDHFVLRSRRRQQSVGHTLSFGSYMCVRMSAMADGYTSVRRCGWTAPHVRIRLSEHLFASICSRSACVRIHLHQIQACAGRTRDLASLIRGVLRSEQPSDQRSPPIRAALRSEQPSDQRSPPIRAAL